MILMNHTIRMVLFLAFVPAQIAAQRPDAFALRDSLATVNEVAVLLRLQAQTPMPGAARTPDEVVRRGLIALRIYELTEDRADSARIAFRKRPGCITGWGFRTRMRRKSG
jgi:hypothetical protein